MGNMVADEEENVKICACFECPSHKNSPLTGALYCARGKSKEAVIESGCMCSFCTVATKHRLALEYYCVRGKSSDLPG